MNRFSFAMFVVVTGCAPVDDAPQVLVPEDVVVRWDSSFNGVDDGRAALIPVDVMVYGGASGAPVDLVDVMALAPAGEVALIDPEAVFPASSADEGFWDAWSDRYLAVDDARVGAPLRLTTDASGVVRFYVWVDAFPAATADLRRHDASAVWSGLPIVVGMTEIEDTFLLIPR
jgi:hypothetical protein